MTVPRLLLLGSLLAPMPVAAQAVRFDVEVMAVLSRAGCNQGACHGNLNGKGGLKLSLRGEDPNRDYRILTRDQLGRRVDPLQPDQSLILKKATAAIPHEGGRRFAIDSPEYAILKQWIARGARRESVAATLVGLEATPAERILVEPEDRVDLSVRASWSDGRTTDVTRLACYESASPGVADADADGSVRRRQFGETVIAVRFLNRQATVRLAFVPARPEFQPSSPPPVNYIDRHIFAKLHSLRMNPSPPADDSTFLRRVYLDTIGSLPTVAEIVEFASDQRPDKRSRLIDELVHRPEFADLWALKWSDLLRNEEKVLDRKGVEVFHGWLRQAIAQGRPINELARELIAARGSTYAHPPANYYRALRDPVSRAEATAQVFLGVRLQCAKCHNHPFDRWTMDDYYRLAAFFPRVQYRIVENNRKDRFDQHEFDGEQIVWIDRRGELNDPRTGAAVLPAFLADARPLPSHTDRLQALADWVADPNNVFFARTQANRIWGHLMGRGLVDPVDDFRATNPPSHPALLDELADDLVAHRFDLRHLVRTILNSQTYQLSSVPNETNADDETHFAKAIVRRLDAEVLADAVALLTEVPVKYNGQPAGLRAVQLPGTQPVARRGRVGMGERFMKAFGKPDRLLSCECERSGDVTVPQTLQLMSGELVTSVIAAPNNRLGRLLAAGCSDGEIIDELFLAALSRPPTAAERQLVTDHQRESKDRRAAFEDVLWGLINSKEFLVRR